MAITDLTGTKWEFESTLSDNISLDVSINYTSNETSFDRLAIVFIASISYAQITYMSGQTQTNAYNKGWLNDAFKTIEITGGTDATNASLIAFIEAHATQVVEPTDVMISYGGSYIATMSDSGTEVLETNGTFLTDDITVEYTKPSAPTPTLQSKSVSYTPTTSQQTASVTADAGYDGLSAVNVTVNAMPSGTAGTPNATKGTVSNHSVSVTPSVTNTTGYITGGTKTGTAVTVSASELASGTKIITANGEGIDVVGYLDVDVNVTPTLQSKSLTYSPSIVQQTDTVTADSGYDGLSSVNVTVDAVSRGTAGTPTATKGTVSNNSVSVTPSVTNVGGMIAGGTRTGTAVTVSASELVSGTLSITSNGTYNVANFSSAEVNVSGGGGDNALADFIMNHGTITSLELPSITSIGQGAFAYCASLTTASFPSCTTIGSSAFFCCSKLTTASFPACKSIMTSAFASCSSLTTVSFPLCTSISSRAFWYCSKLTTASFPSCVTIESEAFYNCSKLSEISFPVCKSVKDEAFGNCSSLTTASFPSCTSIGYGVFYTCKMLETANFPLCVTIGSYAFANCSSLTTVSFPSCAKISNSAFYYCFRMTTVSFPTCKSIGSNAFLRCYSLVSLYLLGSSIPSLANSNAFSSTPIGGYTTSTGGVYGNIFVPSSLYSSYKTATNWTYFSSRFVSV